MNVNVPRLCPECKRDDKIEKVSVIYDRGRVTTTTSYRYGVEEIRGNATQLSSLARRLAPPEPPPSPTFKNRRSIFGCSKIFGIFFLFYFWMSYITQVGTMPSDLAIISLVGLSIVSLWLLWSAVRNWRKQADSGETKKQEQEEYESALYRWKHSYFCHRCDVVFINKRTSSNG